VVKRVDLIRQLGSLIVDLDAVVVPEGRQVELSALCATARIAFGAAAVSVAALNGEVLSYLSASGEGADVIVGTDLAVSRGISGYVALTGQALAVEQVAQDPRFARDVAERTGYVPTSLLVVPINGPDDDVAGVLSVLDRSVGDIDALALATAFGAQASIALAEIRVATAGSHVVFDALIEAVRAADSGLADALRRSLRRLPEADWDLADVAVVLAGLRRLDEDTRRRTVGLIGEIIDLAESRSARSAGRSR